MSANFTLLHHVHDRFDMAGAERQVVGDAGDTAGVKVDRDCRCAARRFGPKRGVLELPERFDVEILTGIVLQRLVDDRCDLMLGEGE